MSNIIDKIQLSGVTYDIGGSGGGGTVDETPIYTIWENDFRDVSQSINVRKAILDFQGDKSITTGTYVYVQILNKTSGQWYYPNATLNYVEGTYTKREDDNNYLVVEYNSEIEDFIISVSDDYPNAILFSVSFYSNKIKIESATIESGDTSDVIETSVANIFGDLYTKDLNSVNMTSLEVASPKNLRLVSEKKNGTNNSQSIKLDDLIVTVNGADKTFSTDIKVPLGTSGWTEVSDISASRCNVEYLGEPLPFTSFRITYNTNDMGMINLRLRAGTTSFSTMFYINWDSSQNKFVVSNETFSATTITLDTTNHILTVELPATVEYGGTQGQTILFALNSDSCQFGYSITKLEYYGEETQDLKPYVQLLRTDVDTLSGQVSSKISTSAVTTAVTSGSTDAEIPTAKAVYDAIGQGGGGGSYTPGDGIDITNNVISVTGMVATSAVTTALTSSSTNVQVPSAKCVYDQVGGLKLVKLTQSAYDALSPNYDSNTLYVING